MWKKFFCVCLASLLGSCLHGDGVGNVVCLLPDVPDHMTRFAPQWMAPGQRRIAISLRGGSAKGLAHIGVLQRFEEEGLPLHGLTGTSAGAIVAAMAASGFSGPSMAKLFQSIDLGTLLDDRRRSDGSTLVEEEARTGDLINLEFTGKQFDVLLGRERTLRVQSVLRDLFAHTILTGSGDFDHLRVPTRIVATDLQTGDPWVFRDGFLAMAVQASMSIPGMLAPVELNGHQLVDGGLVENLPIDVSRSAFPGMLQVGVDISRSWDRSRVGSLPVILGRSLDVSMRQNELRSKQRADLLISPLTDFSMEFDFHHQVTALVLAGREAFDRVLPMLESQIYGPDGESVVATMPLLAEESMGSLVGDLIQTSLPHAGRVKRKDLYRLLRRMHHWMPIAEAWVELPTDPKQSARLHFREQPRIQRVDLLLPLGLSPEEIRRYRDSFNRSGLLVGEPFNPNVLDTCLADASISGALPGCASLHFNESGFNSETGVLRLEGRATLLREIEVQPGPMAGSIHAFLSDMEGKPVHPSDLNRRIRQAQNRFGLADFTGEIQKGPGDILLKLQPVREGGIGLSLAPAYESNWGAHLGVDLRVRYPLGLPLAIQASGSIDSWQRLASFSLDRELAWLPGCGYTTSFSFCRQQFDDICINNSSDCRLDEGLQIRKQAWGVALWGRFARNDRGMVRMSAQERYASYSAGGLDSSRQKERTMQVSGEWDSLDYHTLPTDGIVARLRLGRSFQVDKDAEPFKFAYGRFRILQPLPGLPLGFDLDLESSLGWNTPLPRWSTFGGSGSMIGTQTASFLVSNAAVVRFGLPFNSSNVFGLAIQITPRVDWGRFSDDNGGLAQGTHVYGYGLLISSVIRSFNVEMSCGRAQIHGDQRYGNHQENAFTILVCTRPFDLWRQQP